MAPPVSVRRNSRSGVSALRAHAVRPEKADDREVPLPLSEEGTLRVLPGDCPAGSSTRAEAGLVTDTFRTATKPPSSIRPSQRARARASPRTRSIRRAQSACGSCRRPRSHDDGRSSWSRRTNEKGDVVTVGEVIKHHPQPVSLDRDVLLRCIDECFDCAATCTSCADACLGEADLQELIRCVRLNLDCADVCDAAGRVLTRQTEPDLGVIRAAMQACATACRACGDECERHAAHHEHCRICAEVCRRCEEACNDVIAAIG